MMVGMFYALPISHFLEDESRFLKKERERQHPITIENKLIFHKSLVFNGLRRKHANIETSIKQGGMNSALYIASEHGGNL